MIKVLSEIQQNSENEIYSLVRKVRDFINDPRIKAELLKDKPLFYQLCSCMDMVADSQLAIDAFGNTHNESPSKGRVYLEIFGLLQAMYVQQDAAKNLGESLRFTIEEYPRLHEIREIRNNAAGHPTKRRPKPSAPPNSWNFIIQHSLSYDHFEILCWHSPTGHTTITVHTQEIIEDQQKYIAEILEKTFSEIKRRDDEYKTKFKMKKIRDTLPDTMDYMCEKMSSAINHMSELNLGKFGATSLQNSLARFEDELKERSIAIDTYPGIQITFTDLQYPLEKLQKYFSGSTSLDKEAAHIFVDFVKTNLNDLRKMADELDEEFAK